MKGAIFDLDGTLLDSMHLWEQVDEEYFAALGRAVPEGYARTIRDMTMLQAAEYTKVITGVSESAEEICSQWRRMVALRYEMDVPLKVGALEFLRFLRGRGVKLGVATTLTEDMYMPALSRLKIADFFSVRVSVRDVGKGKGFPDVYLRAASAMGLSASECVVFEDILMGLVSARGAGFFTVAVADDSSSADKAAIERACSFYIQDFTQPELKELFG